MKINFNILVYIALGVFILLFFKECKKEPEVVTKTEIKTVYDTITNTVISKPKTVYVPREVKHTDTIYNETVKTIKDTVYIEMVEANKYETKLQSNKATADLQITTTGELLDVKGVITYPQVKETVKTPKSGLFISLDTSVKPTFERAGISLD